MDVKVGRPTFSVRGRVASSINRLSIKSINKRKILDRGVSMREFGLVCEAVYEEKLRQSLPETHLERHLEGKRREEGRYGSWKEMEGYADPDGEEMLI